MRWITEGFIYDSGGPGVFADENKRLFILGCMNSKPANILLKLQNPTINLQIADVVTIAGGLQMDQLTNSVFDLSPPEKLQLVEDLWTRYKSHSCERRSLY